MLYRVYTHYFSDTAQILNRKRRQWGRSKVLVGKDQFFFKMLTKQIQVHFNAQSIDDFVGRFKLAYPSHSCHWSGTIAN